MSRGMYLLHMDAFWVCLAIGVVTFAALFYSMIKYRRSKGGERLSIEVLWASIPVLILILLAVPAVRLLIKHHASATKSTQQPAEVVAAKPLSKTELMQLGRATYTKSCAVCHQLNGMGLPPEFPALKGAPVSTGPTVAQIEIVLNGKPATSMQAFRNQLSDKEIAAVITYVRNSWGNQAQVKKHGSVLLVQPADVAKARQ